MIDVCQSWLPISLMTVTCSCLVSARSITRRISRIPTDRTLGHRPSESTGVPPVVVLPRLSAWKKSPTLTISAFLAAGARSTRWSTAE